VAAGTALPLRNFHHATQIEHHDPIAAESHGARSCEMNSSDSCMRRCRSRSRLPICDLIETSSADRGSSHTIRSGCAINARDGDALCLAAGELVRVSLHMISFEPDGLQRLQHALHSLRR